MADFFVKAGTFVKHGTSSIHLRSILEKGLVPGLGRHELRKQSEKSPALDAVYVGGLAAYFGAQAAHMSVMKEYMLAVPDFKEKAQAYFADAKKAKVTVDIGEVTMSVPIVLNIRLGKDVRMIADEDYLNEDELSLDDEQVWNRWNAGGVIDGIPADWIKTIEYPRLVTVDDYWSRRALVRQDMELLVMGGISVSEKWPPSTLKLPRGVKNLSQELKFGAVEIEKFFAIKQMAESSNRFLSQCMQVSLFNEVSEQHNYTALEF
ncbi:hypothetical protein [Pseudoduganella violacea]|uniref:Uncharacterized protein n=1 Tax=Pseudoduganella violacea TaxID=1715466 RepID=A0A7W5BG12_9BURK|nr:hypothetical protein [Pseudoduganella violacea]MBB3122461.1 hypothetical protein [Pseudoduganella violacea]